MTIAYMSTLRHSYGDSVILTSLKTSVPETKISVIWRSPLDKKNVEIYLVIKSESSLYLTMAGQYSLKFGIGIGHYRCHIVCKKETDGSQDYLHNPSCEWPKKGTMHCNLPHSTTTNVSSCHVIYLAFIGRWDTLITSLSSSISADLQHLAYVL